MRPSNGDRRSLLDVLSVAEFNCAADKGFSALPTHNEVGVMRAGRSASWASSQSKQVWRWGGAEADHEEGLEEKEDGTEEEVHAVEHLLDRVPAHHNPAICDEEGGEVRAVG